MARRASAATNAMAAARSKAFATSVPKPIDSVPNLQQKSQLSDAEIDAALLRGERLKKVLPRATAARYDRKARMIVITFANGAVFSFPPALVQGFSKATAEELAAIRILGNGSGLHWEALDTDLSVAGLLNHIFGSRKWMARLAGQVKSPAKTAAVRSNGTKGGRPRKASNSEKR
jgi:hypothetical protein